MVHINYDHKSNIYYITESGFVSFEEKVELVHKALSLIKHKSKVKVLHDMRKAEYEESDVLEKGLSKLVSYFKDMEDIAIKHAAIHENALGTAISMLFEYSELPESFSHKTFSSKEAALNWLLND